jgi:hypothetical protein
MSTLGTLGGFLKTFDGVITKYGRMFSNCMFSKSYDALKFEIHVPKLRTMF